MVRVRPERLGGPCRPPAPHPQRSLSIMLKFSQEERAEIMAAVDALALQLAAHVPLY